MTPNSAYIDWLDREIEKAEIAMGIESRKYEPDASHYGRWVALEQAKEKFLSLYPSQEVNTKINDKEE